MALSSLDDKSHSPGHEELESVLGKSVKWWGKLVSTVAEEHGPVDEIWSFAGAKFGWSLRLKKKDRILLYLIPQKGVFLAGVVLGEKAVKAARESALPPAVIGLIDAAKPYVEGRGIRVPVKNARDVAAVVKLTQLKLGSS